LGKQVYCVPKARIVHHENNRAGTRKSAWRIWQFHMGALRLYRKSLALGWLDPRCWFAAAMLTARGMCMLLVNLTKPKAENAAESKQTSVASFPVDQIVEGGQSRV
jgi:hypothetical protein